MMTWIKIIAEAEKNARLVEALREEHKIRTPEVFYAFAEGALFYDK